MIDNLLERFLSEVEKPARYTGNELNMCRKDLAAVDVRFAFCFPDVYEVGMSHLGMRILYHLLNVRDDVYCERIFAPWPDMEEVMRREGIALASLETFSALSEFDIVGFTLQYELCYSNVLNMLRLGKLPLLSSERAETAPLIIAGGPCAVNPEPLAPFVDVFIVGDGEEATLQLVDVFKKHRGAPREKMLEHIAREVEGAYVPRFIDVEYNADGTVAKLSPNRDVPFPVKKAIVRSLDSAFYPEELIVPYMGIVHDRVTLEIFRGCTRGCRFCQAGYIYRPVRERKLDTVASQAERLIDSTGYEEISLCSLSSGDYSELSTLIKRLRETHGPKGVSVALPSLRIDSFSGEDAAALSEGKKSGLTFAPEAGSQRMRDVINKGVTADDLKRTVLAAFENGWNRVKLYFMIGLPTETYDDLGAIAELADLVVNTYYSVDKERRARGLTVTVSASTFVPKPFTPFQWAGQDGLDTIMDKQRYMATKLKRKFVKFNWHDPRTSVLEACFARGDRRLALVLEKAVEKGQRFDGWSEFFSFDNYVQAFDEAGLSMAFYAERERGYDETLPWSHIDVGVSDAYLRAENEASGRAEVTPDCRGGCRACGLEAEVCG